MALQALPLAAQENSSTGTSANVKSFLDLLAKPDVQKWLTDQSAAEAAVENADGRPTDTSLFTSQIGDIRHHIERVIAGLPQLPIDLSLAAQIVKVELAGYGALNVIGLIVSFAALGLSAARSACH